jgi:hypothetical protein
MDLVMETYFPSFDDHSKMFKGNTIKQFDLRQNSGNLGMDSTDSWFDQDSPPTE